MSDNEISWNLSEIYTKSDDPKIKEDMKKLEEMADKFVEDYKGKINSSDITPKKILNVIKEQEDFYTKLQELRLYCSLNFSAKMTDPQNQQLYNRYQDFQTKMLQKLTFLELELSKLIYSKKELLEDPILENCHHYLEKLSRFAPHKLPEAQEQIILEKDQFGVKNWSELQSVWLNTRKFKVEVEGKEKILSYGEANGLITHPDRKTRESANKAIYGKLGEDDKIFAMALRSICSDWMKIVKRRNYKNPMENSLLINDTEQRIINNLLKTIENNVDLYQRYLKLKAKIMSLPKLGCHDVQGPAKPEVEPDYKWKNAKKLVLEAYTGFDETFGEYVQDMFSKNHIDATIRDGKRNGAFCASWYNNKTAFVLLSYAESMKDVFTLGHELGHAIHGHLYSRNQTYLNTDTPMIVAETASIFGELLLTDLMLKKAETKEEKISILTSVLDNAGMVLFQVTSRAWFEQTLYDLIEKGEYIDGETIAKSWESARDKVYGDAVDWFEEMKWEWAMKPHYFMPNFRFYNYPYVYGQMFVYALYQKYQEEGDSFIPKYKELLKAGSSLSPKELGEIVGLDVTTVEFWELGMHQFKKFLEDLEALL
ncbi:MAG: M3 family oligoendopeptidase [Candidatus Lokiarchaeota archaeon]